MASKLLPAMITTYQAAQICDVTQPTLAYYAKVGHLKTRTKRDGRVVYQLDEVIRFANGLRQRTRHGRKSPKPALTSIVMEILG